MLETYVQFCRSRSARIKPVQPHVIAIPQFPWLVSTASAVRQVKHMSDEALTPDRILDAAEDVLRRYGPAKATVVDVARALGVSHRSVYRHFPSKAEIRQSGGYALALAADVMNASEVQRLAQQTVERFGTVHVLVNNAGGAGGFASFEDLSDEDWINIFNLNVLSTVRMTRALLPFMKQQKWGRIINIASESGIQPDPFMPHYNAAKAAVINLTKSLSKAYASDGILVNTVSPAFIKTPLVEQLLAAQAQEQGGTPQKAEQAFLRQNRPHIELGRPGTPEEVASAVVFLASEPASCSP